MTELNLYILTNLIFIGIFSSGTSYYPILQERALEYRDVQ